VDELTFTFAPSPGSNDHEVRPLASGLDILESMLEEGDLGLDPPDFFRQPALLQGGQALIGRCSCGVLGCGDQEVDIKVAPDFVRWDMPCGKRFEFDPEQYRSAVVAAASSTSWESMERTAERLVAGLDYSSRAEQGYAFQWASARIRRGQVTLSFSKDGRQVLAEVAWNHSDPEDARERVSRWLAI
jgi:hypothetical protein